MNLDVGPPCEPCPGGRIVRREGSRKWSSSKGFERRCHGVRKRFGQAVALGRGRRCDRYPHLRMVASGVPSGGVRPEALRQRRQVDQSGRRREPAYHAGASVRALHGHARAGVSPQPHHPSHETRLRRPRQGQVGTDHHGRGIRHHQGKARLLQDHLRRAVHDHLHRHGPARRRHGRFGRL